MDATRKPLIEPGLPLRILTPPQGSPLPEGTKRGAREASGVFRDGETLTPEQGGTAKTREMARAVLAVYENS